MKTTEANQKMIVLDGFAQKFGHPNTSKAHECQADDCTEDLRKTDNYFTVNGDSMDDGSRRSICHGDVVLGRELARHHWQNKLHYKNVLFIIIHPTEGICFKEIIAHNPESGEVICHSWNSQYDDFTINLKDVKQIFRIHKIVERDMSLSI